MAHHHRHKRDAKPEPVQTMVSIVYVTASKTFDGEPAGYTTLGGSEEGSVTSYYVYATIDGAIASWLTTETISAPSVATTMDPTSTTEVTSTAVKSALKSVVKSSAASDTTGLSIDTTSAISDPSTTLAKSQTSVLVASPSTFKTSTTATGASESSTSSSTASPDSTNGTTHPLSGGAIAGIVVVVLLVCVGVWGLIAFRNKKKKQAANEALAAEKDDYPRNDLLAAKRTPSNAAAPQIRALRPVTQFSPDLGNAESFAMETAKGWDRNMSEKREMNKENPFGTHAAANSNEENQANPFGNHAATADGTKVLEGAAVGAAVGAAAGALARPQAPRRSLSLGKDLPEPLKLTKTAENRGTDSPTDSLSSSSSDPAVLAATKAAEASGKPSDVHRVQIEFVPTMDDEIALSAGRLVRLQQAFDDGWCFVVRLDNGKTGVCPRSCLSNRPVKSKPRPQGPQQGRAMTPTQGRPMTPNQGPPMTPTNGSPAMSQAPRTPPSGQLPMRPVVAPGQARPMTPSSGGMSQVRTQSPAMMTQGRPQSPAMKQGRPQSPAMMNQGRPQSPAMMGQGRAQSPAMMNQGRAQSPAMMNQGRPQSPATMNQGRAQSPAMMNQGRAQSPAMMNQAPRPMSPAASSAFPEDLTMNTENPVEQRSRSASAASQNQGPRKVPVGPSPFNPAASAPTLASSSQDEQSFSAESTLPSLPTSAPTSPAKSVPRSQIPLSATPVGRKPVPGQAL